MIIGLTQSQIARHEQTLNNAKDLMVDALEALPNIERITLTIEKPVLNLLLQVARQAGGSLKDLSDGKTIDLERWNAYLEKMGPALQSAIQNGGMTYKVE